MPVRELAQTALDENVVENPSLETALEARETAKRAAGEARKVYRQHDEEVRGYLTVELADDLEAGPIRVGRFVIESRPVAGRSVAFDTDPTTRLTIRARNDD